MKMDSRLQRAFRTLLANLRVETQGKYSVQRIAELSNYTATTSVLRRFIVLAATPVPCLLITLSLEIIPLQSPDEGPSANWAFHLRAWGMIIVLTYLLFYQFSHYLSMLPFSRAQHITVSILVASVAMIIDFCIGHFQAFPIPFSLVITSPIWITTVVLAIALLWGREAHERYQELKQPLTNAFNVWSCQISLVSVYPAYYYAYSLLSTGARTAFSLFLPAMKLFMRAWTNSAVVLLEDEVPVLVVMSVDIFSALFVMYCIQITPSLPTTAGLLAIDVAQSMLALIDVNSVLNEAKHTCRKSLKKCDVQARVTAKSIVSTAVAKMSLRPMECGPQKQMYWWTQAAVVHPVDTAHINVGTTGPTFINGKEENGHNKQNQVSAIATQRILYVTEFLLLVNYVEIVVPIIYATYLAAIYNLPNRQFFGHIKDMPSNQLYATVTSLYLYALVELLSLLVLHAILKRWLSLSGLAQLAFVLENQFANTQMCFAFWVLYNAQPGLIHYGYDYTFEFAWLNHKSN